MTEKECDHSLSYSDYCGCYVCSKCSAHFSDREGTRRLARCYCGWNLANGEKLEDDIGVATFDGKSWDVDY